MHCLLYRSAGMRISTTLKGGFVVKKIISFALALVMVLSMCSFAIAEEPVTIVFSWMHMNKTIDQDALQTVEDAVNAITEERIGVHVKLLPIDASNYTTTIELMFAGNEQLDLYFPGSLPDAVRKGMAMDITELAPKYAPDAVAQTGDEVMKCVTYDGKIWGLPVDKGFVMTPNWLYRVDLAEAAGIDLSNLKDIGDWTDVFAKFKEAYPEMYPLFIAQGGAGLMNFLQNSDYDSLGDNTGAALIGDTAKEGKVTNLFESDAFKALAYQIRDWYEAGYISPDAATTTLGDRDAVASDHYWSYFGGNAGNYFANEASQNIGYEMGWVQTAKKFVASNSPARVSYAVNSMCEHPEKALEFLNLTYSDVDIVNLIIYGIEGRDYVLNDKGFVEWPEGLDMNTVPYTSQFACGVVGSQYKQYELAGVPEDNKAVMAEDDANAERSIALGFTFDNYAYSTEITMITNVVNQYLNSLMSGSVDVDSTLEAFNKDLYAAGLQTIIDAKQAQLDAFLGK